MALNNLADLFLDELRDVLSAEQQLVKALPKMVAKASHPELVKAFQNHLVETQQQVERVQSAFVDTGKAARAKTCEAMKGLLEETSAMMKNEADPDVMDAVLIACAQKVEHYEIATYGTLCTWAKILGYGDALKLLKQNIAEEEIADRKLSEISMQINQQAMA
jgi:ferritin-like metal-binding protein YciE